MIQYIPFTQKIFSNNLSVNVTSLQSKRGEHEAGTVGHHYPMVCSHGGVIYWLLFSIITPWMQRALRS